MTQEQNNSFEAIKAEILRRAKEARACTEQYGRAYKAETLPELLNVVKDNFHWCADKQVVDAELINKYRDEFAANQIYHNVDVMLGYLLANDSATVKAYDSATVEAYDSAYCYLYYKKNFELHDKAICRVEVTNEIYYASDNLRFVKQP